jgi:L-fucose mutarotase/ribose pyranase (RbsD/FucU family)
MTWNWLTKPETPYTWRFVRNVVIKGVILFALVNVLFALLNPLSALGRLSTYNTLIPGRPRLPYGENPDRSYNLSLQNLDALFASHEINRASGDEYRVLVIGDSSVWGVLLDADQTLSAYLNAADLRTSDGKPVRFYNLGYPIQSLAKDLLIFDYALNRTNPDAVIWLVTLESFSPQAQMASLLVRQNPRPINALAREYQLPINADDPRFERPDLLGQTIIGKRRELADLLRLQLYGTLWGVTGLDQRYPRFYEPRMEDFDPADFDSITAWQGFEQDTLSEDDLAWRVLDAGIVLADPLPVLIVNEPIFISDGVNSDIRYNFFYPRWAYDQYRVWLAERYPNVLDLWDAIPPSEFTDSAVHLTPAGSQRLAELLTERITAEFLGVIR